MERDHQANVVPQEEGEQPLAINGGEEDHEEEREDVFSGPARYVPPEMKLTEQECNWAWDIVQEVEARRTILTDMEYAIFALVTKGNTEEASRRADGLQYFREAYGVQDTVEEGMSILEEFIRLQPGVLLNVDALDTNGTLLAMDFGAYYPKKALETEAIWRIHVLFFYYLGRMFHPTLESVREGVTILAEGAMGWDNVDLTSDERLSAELIMHDPHHYKHILVYNTNSVANVAFSLCKPLLPVQFTSVWRLGCQFELHHNSDSPKLNLVDVFLQPTFEVAMQHMLQRARALLQLRYQYEQNYLLECP